MNAVIAWFVGASYITWRYGYKCNMFPTPHRFLALTAFISMASLVSMANPTVGALLGYGSLLGMYLRGQQTANSAKPDCDKFNTSGGSQSNSNAVPQPQPAPAPSGGSPAGQPHPMPGPL